MHVIKFKIVPPADFRIPASHERDTSYSEYKALGPAKDLFGVIFDPIATSGIHQDRKAMLSPVYFHDHAINPGSFASRALLAISEGVRKAIVDQASGLIVFASNPCKLMHNCENAHPEGGGGHF